MSPRLALAVLLLAATASAQQHFRVLFGGADSAVEDWSGSLSAQGGEVSITAMHHFGPEDSFTATSWTASNQWDGILNMLPQEQAVFSPARWKGIHIAVVGTEQTSISIRTAHGDAEFRPAAVPFMSAHPLLDGRVRVERIPTSARMAGADSDDDDPAVATGPDGRIWVAWTEHRDGQETLRIRHSDDGQSWSEAESLSQPGDIHQPALISPGEGRLLAVWSATVAGQVDLYARVYASGAWSSVEQLTQSPGPDTFPALAVSDEGKVFLAWQSAGRGKTDVSLRTWRDGKWSVAQKVTEHPASDWAPAVAVNSRGEAAVAWDSYRHGNYDVFLRRFTAGKLGPLERITDSEDFEAHAALAYDKRDRLWIAYDNSGPNWGKDNHGIKGYLRNEGGLYFKRQVEVRVLERGRLMQPGRPLDENLPGKPVLGSRMTLGLPSSYQTFSENPVLRVDGYGRVWAVVRMRTIGRLNPPERSTRSILPYWTHQAVMFDGQGWSAPIPVPYSDGRQNQRPAVAVHPSGDLWLAAQTDGWSLAHDHEDYAQYDVYASRVALNRVPGGSLDRESLVGSGRAPEIVPDDQPRLIAPIWKTYEMEVSGAKYKVTWGDLHRHTDLSFDGQSDGSMYDVYRYAVDAAEMDFLGPSEHLLPQKDLSDYVWRQVDKAVDFYKLPGLFYPLLNYERTVKYPDGHRNIVSNARGYQPIRIKEGEGPADAAEDDQPYLWRTLLGGKQKPDGFSIPHTTATQMGTDWRYNDERVERLVEMYQGNRDSYEYFGAPRGAVATELLVGGYISSGSMRPKGFVWNALAKGYKMGFIASSDHRATHNSYAAVYTPDRSYDSIWQALYDRRTYAATDNIVVDFQSEGRAMGDEFKTDQPPRLEIALIGTSKIAQIDVIKDNEIVYTGNPDVQELSFTYTDREVTPGEHYYYVRVIQDDKNMAWASPIWITYEP